MNYAREKPTVARRIFPNDLFAASVGRVLVTLISNCELEIFVI